MPQDGEQCYEESFNSFLAGVLLTRRCIDNFEFFNLMNAFINTYNVDIASVGNDICVPIYLDDNEIKLFKDIDEIILINGRKTTIRCYLYSFTTPRVREFFGMHDLKSKHINSNGKFMPFVRTLLKKKITI